jgi:hypothetical protein
MKIEKNEKGEKVFSGTFEGGRTLARPQPNELGIEKLIKKIIIGRRTKK